MSKRSATLLALAAALALFLALDLHQFLRFSTIKQSHSYLVELYRAAPAPFVAAFMTIHICALALCLPGAVLTMALAGGAIFGPVVGTIVVLTSLTIGDSLGFLAARHLVGDWVRQRYARQLARIDSEIDSNGAFYLLSLRLMAAMPYFVVNVAFGLTPMRLRVFAPVSFVGLAPATALYVNAGTELARIETARDVLSPGLVASFVLLAFLPLAARYVQGRRRLAARQAAGD